ncbi:MAG: beta-galactosidase [Luteolibacter sp.]|jgi:hypothetical protein|nr:beta-galactosidase [Luteolibacter sp.]
MRTIHPFPCLFLTIGLLQAQETAAIFPFVVPELATPPQGSIVDMSWLNEKPAGGKGFVRVRDGRFVDGGGKRLRFLATNFTFGSCFPERATADKLAARLASLGINCIRFHHADNQAAPGGIWKADTPKRNEFDPGQIDRLDYFIAALKRHGIYSNINLHVSRNYWEGEDFPDGLANDRERRALLPDYGKGIDRINEQMIRMQRDYARTLLTHVNPYTQTSYANEPCVAIVEINNENTLLELDVASLPEYYRADVLRKWNLWLKTRYDSTEKLDAAWGGNEVMGENLLVSAPTLQGGHYVTVKNAGNGETRVTLLKDPEVSWHAQLHWGGLALEEGKPYTLEFSARSELPRQLPISTRLAKADWHNCGLAEIAGLEKQWKSFSYVFRAKQVEPGAVRLDMVAGGGPAGVFSIKNLALRRGGSLGLHAGESLEVGNVKAPARSQDSPKGIDWTRFLAETERACAEGMRGFLKNELAVEAAILDTQASYGGVAGTYRESLGDFVDMHAYWQHPNFPGRPWDRSNWTIPNTPMVDDRDGGNLARLAVYRVANKPFTVSEYDHPAPSHYAAEMFPMIASFAAIQDWDGVFQFDWGGTDADVRRVNSFFSLQQHPAKLAFLPAAALMFRRGDVSAAIGEASLAIPAAQAERLTATKVSNAEVWNQHGLAAGNFLTHRLNLHFTQDGGATAEITKEAGSPVAWNRETGLYTVNAPSAKAVVGRGTGKTIKLDGAQFEVRANPRNFAVLTLNAADGKPMEQAGRVLLTAVGNVENTGMGWNVNHTSVGSKWGRAPSLCEGIAAKVTLTTAARTAKVHVLDGSGARNGEVPAILHDGKLVFEIGPQFKTLWYEIVLNG